MKATEFCYWLQGFFELDTGTAALSAKQVSTIKQHLSLVFLHDIDPSQGDADHQAKLQEVHDGKKKNLPPFGGEDADGNLMRC
jgi:hypothetical protein